MDRRRFVPSADGLEGRMLLAASAASRPQNQLNTLADKTTRIDRFPQALESIQFGRTLPKPIVTAIQDDIIAIRGRLQSPKPQTLANFNDEIRKASRKATLSQETALALTNAFGRALESAGDTPQHIAQLQADTNKLIQVDVASRDPVRLAVNDYAFILQTALGIGRPIVTPPAPTLAKAERGGPNNVVVGNRRPSLIGTYNPKGTPIGTEIDLLDQDGNVIGTTTTTTNGKYTVAPTAILGYGSHTFRVRAVDAAGDVSNPSAPVTITVVPNGTSVKAHPKGPLGAGS